MAVDRNARDRMIPMGPAGSLLLAPVTGPDNARALVLVVDDNAAKRQAIVAVLAPLGHTIVEAGSGLDALRCVMAQDFAVILLDVRMPEMDGFETAAMIRRRRQSETTPIVFITAYGSDGIDTASRYAVGAVDFLFAQVDPDELRAKVSAFANIFLKAEGLAERAREVQASADQLTLLTEGAPVGIFQTDAEGRYVYTNPRWSSITGVSADGAIGRTWEELICSAQQPQAEAPSGAERCLRFQIELADEVSRIVVATSRQMPDRDGGVAGWVGTLADVTAEAGAEAAMTDARDEANEASRLKSDFLANMSHEIRTPMNGVIGMTDLLLDTNLDERQRDYAQTVRNSGEALMGIINDILDFSKVEAGKLELESVDFDLRRVVGDVIDLLAEPAQSKGLSLVAAVDNGVPESLRGDPGRVRQILTNLIGNGIKFTRSGEVVVRVVLDDASGASVVRFEVSDTGEGIADGKRALIFQPFVQADSSTHRKYGGTGLGLAICGQLIALMGGGCGVSSRLGEGSTFWFTVGFGASSEAALSEPPECDPDLLGATVLAVNESEVQRGVIAQCLSQLGVRPSTADSGESALEVLHAARSEERAFDAVLIDRSMPVQNGVALEEAIRSDPAIDAPVILLGTLQEEREAARSTDPGRGASLAKPVHREELQRCLRSALGFAAAPVDAAPAAVEPGSPGGAVPACGRLLLAEDNLINQKVAVAMLTGAGYRVDTVPDGNAALHAVAAHPYDAVLMDCQMPELNGYEATAAIRALEGADRHTPIIALTAGARREDRDRCIASGMDSYLAKPVSRDALLALVARYVNGAAAGAELPGREGRSAAMNADANGAQTLRAAHG